MRFRSSLFGAFAVITLGQLSSCFVPPANPESAVVACQSSRPLNDQPQNVLVLVRCGAEPVHPFGAAPPPELFQSIPAAALSTRLPSSSSNPAFEPTGPANAGITRMNATIAATVTKTARRVRGPRILS